VLITEKDSDNRLLLVPKSVNPEKIRTDTNVSKRFGQWFWAKCN